jgi:glucosyl-dolichyl phosphate glucuronosyltransferase
LALDLTIAICTWNRAALLDQTLMRLREAEIPIDISWELLVVDNNCTDNTQVVLAKHTKHFPLKILQELQQGHSHARNRAVREAQGNWLIWTDDDVLVPADWLMQYWQAMQLFPEAAYFVGPVRPWFENTPPAWVIRHSAKLQSFWALVDHGPEVRKLTEKEYGFGANMAFKLELLKAHPFDARRGRVANRLTSGDDSLVIEQLKKQGHFGVWVGTAPVEHWLPSSRLTSQYVFDIHRWNEAAEGFSAFAKDGSSLFRDAPRWMWKRYWLAELRRMMYAFAKGERWLDALLEAARWRGILDRFQAQTRGQSWPPESASG